MEWNILSINPSRRNTGEHEFISLIESDEPLKILGKKHLRQPETEYGENKLGNSLLKYLFVNSYVKTRI